MKEETIAYPSNLNSSNTMAANVAENVFNIRNKKIRESLTSFSGVQHRLEKVSTIYGIDYINDSKSSNLNSTWYALETINQEMVWIMGGSNIKNDYSVLKQVVTDKVKVIVCLGNHKEVVKTFKECVDHIFDVSNMNDAVKIAYQFAEGNDCVMLSPACPSTNLFKNYEDRGNQFIQAVKALEV